MDWLIKHVVNIFKLIKWLSLEFFRIARDYFSAFWAIIAALVGLAVLFWDLAVRLINLLISALTGLSFPDVNLAPSGSAQNALAVANAVFPLDEFCNYFVAYCLIRIGLITFRFVKSWLPRIHGWGFGS